MSALPIPTFYSVKETHSHNPDSGWTSTGSPHRHIVIIAPDPMAGRRHMYSVIRIFYKDGRAECIGRELPLKLARKIATKPYEPLLPVTGNAQPRRQT